jgi:hypothetical protein
MKKKKDIVTIVQAHVAHLADEMGLTHGCKLEVKSATYNSKESRIKLLYRVQPSRAHGAGQRV